MDCYLLDNGAQLKQQESFIQARKWNIAYRSSRSFSGGRSVSDHYNTMRDVDDCLVVTNGSQTDTICEGFIQGESFYDSLHKEKHEPDAPNFTPRISGMIEQKKSSVTLAKISKSDFSAEQSVYHFYHFNEIGAGFGYCLTTYMGDGNPLPPFNGDPILLPLEGDAVQIAKKYWEALNQDNRISLAVRELTVSGKDSLKIINRFDARDGEKI